MAAEIVHDHDVTRGECGRQDLIDIGEEAGAIDRTVEQAGSVDAVVPQRRQEGQSSFASARQSWPWAALRAGTIPAEAPCWSSSMFRR